MDTECFKILSKRVGKSAFFKLPDDSPGLGGWTLNLLRSVPTVGLLLLCKEPRPRLCAVDSGSHVLIPDAVKENLPIFASASCLLLQTRLHHSSNHHLLHLPFHSWSPGAFSHQFQPACTHLFTPPEPLSNPPLSSSLLSVTSPPPGFLSATHTWFVFPPLTFIPLLSRTDPHLSRFFFTCSLPYRSQGHPSVCPSPCWLQIATCLGVKRTPG